MPQESQDFRIELPAWLVYFAARPRGADHLREGRSGRLTMEAWVMRTRFFAIGVAAAMAGTLLLPGQAQAWWRHGPFWGGGIFIGPPVYVAPPPAYYAPPPYYAPPAAAGCYAGPYVCPLQAPAAAGAPCSCPTNDGGWAGGRAR
jgi:hypothetical protein